MAPGRTPAQGQAHSRCSLGPGPVPTKVGRWWKEPAWAWRLRLWGAAADGAWRGAEEAQGNVASRGNVPCSRCPGRAEWELSPATSAAQLLPRSWASTWLSGVCQNRQPLSSAWNSFASKRVILFSLDSRGEITPKIRTSAENTNGTPSLGSALFLRIKPSSENAL